MNITEYSDISENTRKRQHKYKSVKTSIVMASTMSSDVFTKCLEALS